MDWGILFFSKNRCDNFFHRLKLDDHLLMMTSALGIFPADWQSWGHSVKKIHRDFLLCRVYKLFDVIPQKMGVLDIFLFCPFRIGFGLFHGVQTGNLRLILGLLVVIWSFFPHFVKYIIQYHSNFEVSPQIFYRNILLNRNILLRPQVILQKKKIKAEKWKKIQNECPSHFWE